MPVESPYTLRMTRRRLLFEEPELNASEAEEESDDPDYSPSDEESSEYETESSSDENEDIDEDEDEDENMDISSMGYAYRMNRSPSISIHIGSSSNIHKRPSKSHHGKNHNHKYKDLMHKMSPEEKTYFLSVSEEEREQLFLKYKQIVEKETEKTPLRFRILTSPMPDTTKRLILQKLDAFQSMTDASSEYHKYSQWIQSVSRLPIGKYNALQIQSHEISDVLMKTRSTLNDVVHGHEDAKDHILRILAQWISNPSACGHCIGIQGPMGIGKTTLLKEGVSRALNIPFGFVALGGASDASFLEGHSFTYEGSVYGRISEILMKTQIMNPILFFDELDKISDTPKGDEISSILTHITDITQNDRFTDKYFGDIELDLSKTLMIFSFNDESKINPILKDRMTIIRVQGYTNEQKRIIAKNYLMPSILNQYHIDKNALEISDALLQKIIEHMPSEQGVRHLRRGIECIISWMNMARYMVVPPFEDKIIFPHVIQESYLPLFLKSLISKEDGPPPFMYL
jgi:ATP-dependent Lon protease